MKIYYESVGRNSLLLLNVPPDTRGMIDPVDSLRLMEFKAAIDSVFRRNLASGAKVSGPSRGRGYSASNILNDDYDSYWAMDDGELSGSLTLELTVPQTFNRIVLQEYIPLGQRICSFRIEVPEGEEWTEIGRGTTVGYKRILSVPAVTASSVRIVIESALACPTLNGLGLYMDNF